MFRIYIFDPLLGANNFFWRIIGLIVEKEKNCCHGYETGEEAGNLQYRSTFPKTQNTKVCLIRRICPTGVCMRLHGENAPTLTSALQSASRRTDVIAQSRFLARPNNLSREGSCHSASSSRPLKFLDLKGWTTETLLRNRRFGEKTVFWYIQFILSSTDIFVITFCGFVWSCNEESAAVVSNRASHWLHRWKSKFHVNLRTDYVNFVLVKGFLLKMALIIH